jgi:hypothetical protein
MSKKTVLLFALALGVNLTAQDKIELALQTLKEKYPQEKIHVLLNKKSYLAGENIWFKTFVFEGYSPSEISTTLFAELYDKNKTLIDKKLIPLFNGQGNGSFTLPESLKEDVYYIRTYTTWMTNFSEDFQPVKEIPVYNPFSPEKLDINSQSSWTAAVFPESGTFIDGINTKVAVRLQSKGSLPDHWGGYIADAAKPDEKIVSFKGFDENTGVFQMTPQSGRTYKLFIEDSKGNKQNIDLPAVSPSGMHLRVESKTDHIKYSLQSKNLSTPSTFYRVIGTINDQMVFKSMIRELSNEKVYTVPTEKLINGILQISIFDDRDQIVAQRMCFIKPDRLQILQPSLQELSLNEAPRALNSFKIAQNKNIPNYTVSVTDGNFQSSEEDNSLLSTLWLTGDIPSKISSPSQYFTKNHNSDALDAILMSEKWKRFEWRSVMTGAFPMIRNIPEPYISYKGKVSVSDQPAKNATLNLIFNTDKQGMNIYPVKTNDKGFFTLSGLIFENSINFHYQLNADSRETQVAKEKVQVIFQPNYAFVPYRKSLPESRYILTKRSSQDDIPAEVTRYITTKNSQKLINDKTISIQEIKIKGQKKDLTKKLNQELSSSLFRGTDETIFDFVNDENLSLGSANVLQWLDGRVAGLTVQNKAGTYTPLLRGAPTGIYLDEMPATADQLSYLSLSDIAMVKVMKGYFAGGYGGGGNGAIAIYTRRGGTKGRITNPDAPTQLKKISLKGFDQPAPFNTPDYSDGAFNGIPTDTRNVLYWNPDFAGSGDDSTIRFYNNDDAKSYHVIMMGFDKENGVPFYYNEVVK